MKRRNHVVLWSITVLASVGLAGLFIFPASGEGEQHYNCIPNAEGDEYNCTLVEDASANYTHTCADAGWDRIRCTWESWQEQLNFCEWRDSLVCYQGYTKGEINLNWWYYFTKDFWWKFHCNDQRLASLDSNDLITVNDLGTYGCTSIESSEQYSQCDKDEDSFFCLANYECTEDEWWYKCIENSSGDFNCKIKYDGSVERSIDWSEEYVCSYNWSEGSSDSKSCYFDEGSKNFFCPDEYSCEAVPGWTYCVEPHQEDAYEAFYCINDSWFPSIKLEQLVQPVWSSTYKCFTKNGWKQYEDCMFLMGWYYCPKAHSCELESEWYYCDPIDGWEYTCYPDFGSSYAEPQAAGSNSYVMRYTCGKNGTELITNCQVLEDLSGPKSLAESESAYMESYFFCPADKYNCHSENGFMICDPSTTWNYSCSFPQGTAEKAEAEHVLSKSAQSEYAVCTNWSGESYTDCQYYSEWFNDRLVDSAFVNWWYPSMWYYVCPMKYSCDEIKNWKHVCSLDNTKWDFYCRESYWWWGKSIKASELIMWDYTCAQQNGKWYDNCISAENKFYCDVRYSCTPVKWWYQCDIDDEDWEYKCKQSTVFSDTASSNYVCSGPNTYNNCTSNDSGYFCPASVELKLYLWGCVNTNTPTAAVVDATIECDGKGYLWTVLVSKDSWVSVDTLFANDEVKNKLPAPEEWMEWVWYLENSQNADKLSESTQFSVDSKLYVFQDERKIGTIRFNSDWWTDVPSVTGYYNTTIQLPSPTRTWYNFAWWYDGNNKVSISYLIQWDKTLKAHWTENKPSWGYSGWGGSSRWTSKWSWPSSSDVKSVEKGPDTQTKNEPKPEVKPVVKPVNNGWTHWASTGKVSPAQELADAYKWAYANGLTKYANMSDARLDDYLNRQEMAKISTIFATKFHGETPNEAKRKDCSQYPDLWKTTSDMQEFIKQSCELGYMWYRANGVDYLERFCPYTPVSVAEVSIILSRIMWKNKYAISENKWYQWHLHAVYENQLLDDITKPFDYITRRDAYIMLYRLSGKL